MTRPQHKPFFLFTILLAGLFLTVSCAGRASGPDAQARPQRPDSSANREDPDSGVIAEATGEPEMTRLSDEESATEAERVEALIARAQAEYDEGLNHMSRGNTESAREHFDRAVDIFMNADESLGNNQRFLWAFDRFVDEITALETDLLEAPGTTPGTEPAPTEELGEITPELTPEEAEEHLETVKPETEKVTFDIPMEINDKVLGWIDIYQNRPSFRKSFIGGYERFGWYEKMIHEVLEEEGLPADLIYMAFLESTYKTSAYSRARARGIWQFITPTARLYGLKVDHYVDERAHPEKSTRAAARYMKDLYETFNDWHLAIAAYNTGAGNIKKAQRRSGKKNYWDLARSRYMMRETKNFVPAILAIMLIAKDPEKYGFEGLEHNDTLEWDRVTVEGPAKISLIAELTGSSEEDIRFLNPHLRRGVTPPVDGDYEVLVPKGTAPRFIAAYQALPSDQKIAQLQQFHRVGRGETLAKIASRYGTTVRELARTNNIRNPHRIRVGAQLLVPGAGGGDYSDVVPQYRNSGPYHVVRRGETLSGIARAYRVSLGNVFAWNGMNERTILRPGQRILVSGSAARARVAVSGGRHHVVRRGDTLSGISRSYKVPLKDLYAWNGLNRRSVLHPGMKVVVSLEEPAGGSSGESAGNGSTQDKITYRVRRGDNLFRIAMKYGTTVENLKAWNNMVNDVIRAGEMLTIYRN